jgi:hypothetical protein
MQQTSGVQKYSCITLQHIGRFEAHSFTVVWGHGHAAVLYQPDAGCRDTHNVCRLRSRLHVASSCRSLIVARRHVLTSMALSIRPDKMLHSLGERMGRLDQVLLAVVVHHAMQHSPVVFLHSCTTCCLQLSAVAALAEL